MQGHLLLPNRECHRSVYPQSTDRGATNRADSNQSHTLPAEMKPPHITARIEQADAFS